MSNDKGKAQEGPDWSVERYGPNNPYAKTPTRGPSDLRSNDPNTPSRSEQKLAEMWADSLGTWTTHDTVLSAALRRNKIAGFLAGRASLEAENQRLREALSQSLSQWRFYRAETSDNNLDDADHTEAQMFRRFKALAKESDDDQG